MKVKINASLLHIPPFISTSWENVESLSLIDGGILVVMLKSGSKVVIPNLDANTLQNIFTIHSQVLEGKNNPTQIGLGFPLQTGGGIETLGAAIQHNPEQANAPDLPPEVLNKIASVAKVLGVSEEMPKPEPHCNCVYCQIARAFQGIQKTETPEEEEVSQADLSFRSWEIKETADHLYLVTNPLDEKDQYRVHLKEPIGCTCGEKNCEHLRAVLNS